MKGPCLFFLHEGRVGEQGNPCSSPCIQALDLLVAGLPCRPIFGDKGVGEARGEEAEGLLLFGSQEEGEELAKMDNEGFGSRFSPRRESTGSAGQMVAAAKAGRNVGSRGTALLSF